MNPPKTDIREQQERASRCWHYWTSLRKRKDRFDLGEFIKGLFILWTWGIALNLLCVALFIWSAKHCHMENKRGSWDAFAHVWWNHTFQVTFSRYNNSWSAAFDGTPGDLTQNWDGGDNIPMIDPDE